MTKLLTNYLNKSIHALNQLPLSDIETAIETILATYAKNGTWFLAGNGGSAADAQHIAAEMVGRS